MNKAVAQAFPRVTERFSASISVVIDFANEGDLTSLLLGYTKLCHGAVQYRILRQKGTEPAGSGVYNKHKVPSLAILQHLTFMSKVIRADIASPFQLRHMLFTADAVAGGGCIPLRWVPDAPLHVSALPPAEIVSMYECQICFPVQTPVLSMPDKLGIHECCASQVYGG